MEMAQLLCGGCRTLLMYTRGATSVRCSCCHTLNLAPATNQFAHINCGSCRTVLMYPYGAPSVKCALCQYVTNATNNHPRTPIPPQRPESSPSSSTSTQTAVVENPMSFDESGDQCRGRRHDREKIMRRRTLGEFSFLLIKINIIGKDSIVRN